MSVQLSQHNLSAAMKFPLGTCRVTVLRSSCRQHRSFRNLLMVSATFRATMKPQGSVRSWRRLLVLVGICLDQEMPLVPGHCFPTAVAEYTIEDGWGKGLQSFGFRALEVQVCSQY